MTAAPSPDRSSLPSVGARPRAVLLVVGLGTLLTAGSASTVNLALPAIGRELDAPIDVAGWVLTSFLLAVTVLLLVAGQAGDLFGHRRIYLAGFALFGLGSFGAGLSTSIGMLLALRVLQGVGGAMVMATGPALLTTTFPPGERGRALGTLSSATYLGLTIGPPLGGWLVRGLGWRWVFLVNLPTAALALGLGVALLPPGERRRVPFDYAGTAALVLGLPSLLVALTQAERRGWAATGVLGAGAVGIGLLGLFVLLERRSRHPLLDLRLFRSPVFSGAVLGALGNYLGLFVSIVLMPFYLVEARALGSARAGLVLAAQPLVMALVAMPSGRLSDRIGSRGLGTVGLAVLALGLGGLSTIGAGTSVVLVALWLAVIGLGTGVFISPNSSALMGAATKAQQGIAGGVMGVARNLGMILGVTAATSIFVAAGGRTGRVWQAGDYHALRVALWFAAAVCLASAVAAALSGRQPLAEKRGL